MPPGPTWYSKGMSGTAGDLATRAVRLRCSAPAMGAAASRRTRVVTAWCHVRPSAGVTCEGGWLSPLRTRGSRGAAQGGVRVGGVGLEVGHDVVRDHDGDVGLVCDALQRRARLGEPALAVDEVRLADEVAPRDGGDLRPRSSFVAFAGKKSDRETEARTERRNDGTTERWNDGRRRAPSRARRAAPGPAGPAGGGRRARGRRAARRSPRGGGRGPV